MNSQAQAALHHAGEVFRWSIGGAEDLMARLLRSKNSTTQRLYTADLRHWCRWLGGRGYGPAETLPLALAIFLGYGPARAQQIVEDYRDYLAAGKTAATCNRHLVTLRAVVRIAREIGRIDWSISVPNLDNALRHNDGPDMKAA